MQQMEKKKKSNFWIVVGKIKTACSDIQAES